jgi:hypothetical protein
MGIGIIVVDDVYGFPGDVRNASAYPFPIQHAICEGVDSTQIHESSLNPGRFTPHPNPGLDRSQGPL